MTAYSADQGSARVGRTNVQKAAAAVGIVFLLIGVLGFVPGITSNYDQLQFASADSKALLLGLFQVSVLHNIVHLLFGVLGLAMARTASSARTYLVFGGIVYLVLFLYGLLVGQESAANFVPLNGADDILHLLLGVGMIGLGVALTRGRSNVAATPGNVRP
jgi:arginine exporter protein ArgO